MLRTWRGRCQVPRSRAAVWFAPWRRGGGVWKQRNWQKRTPFERGGALRFAGEDRRGDAWRYNLRRMVRPCAYIGTLLRIAWWGGLFRLRLPLQSRENDRGAGSANTAS